MAKMRQFKRPELDHALDTWSAVTHREGYDNSEYELLKHIAIYVADSTDSAVAKLEERLERILLIMEANVIRDV